MILLLYSLCTAVYCVYVCIHLYCAFLACFVAVILVLFIVLPSWCNSEWMNEWIPGIVGGFESAARTPRPCTAKSGNCGSYTVLSGRPFCAGDVESRREASANHWPAPRHVLIVSSHLSPHAHTHTEWLRETRTKKQTNRQTDTQTWLTASVSGLSRAALLHFRHLTPTRAR